jgi:DNA invertase Pin-like site-specific DNA recombinase
MKTKVKVFAYLRVSSPAQAKDDKDGFPRQEKALRDYAELHNLDIVKFYKEDISGTEEYRPVLAELLLSLEQNGHGIKTVIIEKLDRLARDLMVQEGIIVKFTSKGYNLISAVEGAELLVNEPTRKFIRQVLGAVAELDKQMLVARLRASRQRKKLRTGKGEGRKGYDESEGGQQVIQYIKSLHKKPKYYKRLTLQQIADRLNAEGITTLDGKKWSLYRVQAVLKSY